MTDDQNTAPTSTAPSQVPAHPADMREKVARVVKGARLSAAFGREFRKGDGRLDDVDMDAADAVLSLLATSAIDGREGEEATPVSSGEGDRM